MMFNNSSLFGSLSGNQKAMFVCSYYAYLVRVILRPFAFRPRIHWLHLCMGKLKSFLFFHSFIHLFTLFFPVSTELKKPSLHHHLYCVHNGMSVWWCVNRHFTRCITFCGLYNSSTVYEAFVSQIASARFHFDSLHTLHCGGIYIYIFVRSPNYMCMKFVNLCQKFTIVIARMLALFLILHYYMRLPFATYSTGNQTDRPCHHRLYIIVYLA